MQLVIGEKTISSWSMRPWLVMRRFGIAFEEQFVPLYGDPVAKLEGMRLYSPSGQVPVLKDQGLTVHDSLAIVEYLAEISDQPLWPLDQKQRARARAVTAEMHGGFSSLREECSHNLSVRVKITPSDATAKNIRRLVEIFKTLRAEFEGQGAFLFGDYSIADAFFTPVASRFRSYGLDLIAFGDDGRAAAYGETLLSQPEFLDWEAKALLE